MSLRVPRIPAAALAALGVALALALLYGVATALRPSGSPARAPHNRAYASQTTSLKAIHNAYLRWGGADVRDRMGAACEAHSVADWARKLGTAATPQAVSRAVAATADPAFRHAAYLGCMDELGN
jgi:hypothetical protein